MFRSWWIEKMVTKVEKMHVQQDGQFVVKRLTFQILVKLYWQAIWKSKNTVNRSGLFLDPKAIILVKVKAQIYQLLLKEVIIICHSTSSISKSSLDSMMVSTSITHSKICWALKVALSIKVFKRFLWWY